MLPQACYEKRTLSFWADQASAISIWDLRDTFGVNHRLTSNTATAQQNVIAKAELTIRVRIVGFLSLCRYIRCSIARTL
jgi:hypothetical protein